MNQELHVKMHLESFVSVNFRKNQLSGISVELIENGKNGCRFSYLDEFILWAS